MIEFEFLFSVFGLLILVASLLFSDFDLGQSSEWGRAVGISLIPQASTVPPTPLR